MAYIKVIWNKSNGVVTKLDFLVNLPNKPTSLTHPAKVKVKDGVTFSWTNAPVPSQPSGIVLDSQTVYSDIEFFNGISWGNVARGVSTNSIGFNIPTMTDTSLAKFRVRSYVVVGGIKYYTDYNGDNAWVESGTFQVYNNMVPSAPLTFTSPTTGVVIDPLKFLNLDWSDVVDADAGDIVTYEVDFYNGTLWNTIAKNVTASHLNKFTVPAIPGGTTQAKFRVRAYDGRDYGAYTESVTITVNNIELGNLSIPNAIKFDGVDDFYELNNRVIPATGDFTVEFSFKSPESAKIRTLFSLDKDDNNMVLFLDSQGRLNLTVGASTTITSRRFDDDTLHYVAIRRSGNKFELIIDGEIAGTVSQACDFTTQAKMFFGAKKGVAEFFDGIISLARFWNDVRTLEELEAHKNKWVINSEQGLMEQLSFIPSTGQLSGTVTVVKGSIFGGAEWAYKFVPLGEVVLPFPEFPQKKENVEILRKKVEDFRKANGMGEVSWTDKNLIQKVTPIKAIHMNELQNSIQEVYSILGQQISIDQVREVVNLEVTANSEVISGAPSTVVTPPLDSLKDVPVSNSNQVTSSGETVQIPQSTIYENHTQVYKTALKSNLMFRYYNVLRALMNK